MRKDVTTSVEILVDDPNDDLLVQILDEIRSKIKMGVKESHAHYPEYEYYFEVIVKE